MAIVSRKSVWSIWRDPSRSGAPARTPIVNKKERKSTWVCRLWTAASPPFANETSTFPSETQLSPRFWESVWWQAVWQQWFVACLPMNQIWEKRQTPFVMPTMSRTWRSLNYQLISKLLFIIPPSNEGEHWFRKLPLPKDWIKPSKLQRLQKDLKWFKLQSNPPEWTLGNYDKLLSRINLN